MNKHFLLAHLQSGCDWLSFIGMPLMYDLCMCVCRDDVDRQYVKLHKPKLLV